MDTDSNSVCCIMLINLLLLVLISNSIASNYNKSIQYSRFVILGLLSISVIVYSNTYVVSLEKSVGLYNGLFNISTLSQSFNLFIISLSAIISILTAFYPRKVYYILHGVSARYNDPVSLKRIDQRLLDSKAVIYNKNGFQFTIIEYSLITLFILSGAIFLISAGDLISLFLSIELQSYGLYILATIYRNSESATGSGLTYFLLGGLSSCFILLGSAILYVNSGLTNLDNIYILNSISDINVSNSYTTMFEGSSSYINFSFIILIVGLLFKISAAPFHFWSPDVYDGIPTVVTTFVAIIAKISLLILMLELFIHSDLNISNIDLNTLGNNNLSSSPGALTLSTTYDSPWAIKNVLMLSSLMSLIIGSLLGLTQYRIKRLFAYSTISHVGFILLALCVNKIESIQAYIFYILQYSISNLNAFFILIAIGYSLYKYKINNIAAYVLKTNKFIDVENSPVQLLNQIKGYFHINSFLSVSFAITLFSFVGIPPLIGFFAKQMVLSAALDKGYVFMTLVAVVTSVIGAAYYLNIVKLIFFNKSDYVIKARYLSVNGNIAINDKLSIVISVLTMLILLFVFMPDEWFRIVNILSLSINKY